MGAIIGTRKAVVMDLTTPIALDIKQTIADNKVVIYSKSYCPYCKMAKDQFTKLSQDFLTIELDQRDDGNEILQLLGEMTGARTVPRVFVHGNFIGGGTDVKAMYNDGSLKKLFEI